MVSVALCAHDISDKPDLGGSLNVFVVEDSAVVRERLYAMLSAISGVKVIGFAENEAGSIERINTLLPDVVILDLHLQLGMGLNVLFHIKKHHASVKVVVLSNYSNALYVSSCRQAGADYFFDKSFQFMSVGKLLEQLMSPEGLDGSLAGML